VNVGHVVFCFRHGNDAIKGHVYINFKLNIITSALVRYIHVREVISIAFASVPSKHSKVKIITKTANALFVITRRTVFDACSVLKCSHIIIIIIIGVLSRDETRLIEGSPREGGEKLTAITVQHIIPV